MKIYFEPKRYILLPGLFLFVQAIHSQDIRPDALKLSFTSGGACKTARIDINRASADSGKIWFILALDGFIDHGMDSITLRSAANQFVTLNRWRFISDSAWEERPSKSRQESIDHYVLLASLTPIEIAFLKKNRVEQIAFLFAGPPLTLTISRRSGQLIQKMMNDRW